MEDVYVVLVALIAVGMAVILYKRMEGYAQPARIDFKNKGLYYSTGDDDPMIKGVPIPAGSGKKLRPATMSVDEVRSFLTEHVLPKLRAKVTLIDVDQATANLDSHDDLWLEVAFNVYEPRKNVGLKLFAKAVRVDQTWYVVQVRNWNKRPTKQELDRGVDVRDIEEYAPYVPAIQI